MVFAWSNLCDGDPTFTLSQVAPNDLLMVTLFASIVDLLSAGRPLERPLWRRILDAGRLYAILSCIRGAKLTRRIAVWNVRYPNLCPVTCRSGSSNLADIRLTSAYGLVV